MTTVWVLTEGQPWAEGRDAVGVYSELWIAQEVAKKLLGVDPIDWCVSQGQGVWSISAPSRGLAKGYRVVRYEVGTPGGKP